jgi:hypothetical protein
VVPSSRPLQVRQIIMAEGMWQGRLLTFWWPGSREGERRELRERAGFPTCPSKTHPVTSFLQPGPTSLFHHFPITPSNSDSFRGVMIDEDRALTIQSLPQNPSASKHAFHTRAFRTMQLQTVTPCCLELRLRCTQLLGARKKDCIVAAQWPGGRKKGSHPGAACQSPEGQGSCTWLIFRGFSAAFLPKCSLVCSGAAQKAWCSPPSYTVRRL